MSSGSGDYPKLTAREMYIMNSIFIQAMHNPEYAGTLWVNPRPAMLNYLFTEEEILHIASYFKYVEATVEANRTPQSVPVTNE